MDHVTRATPFLGMVGRLIQPTITQNLMTVSLAVPEIFQGGKILKLAT